VISLWIKVCGLTTPDAVAAAVESNVDAIGFVFAPSSRQVTPVRAAELSASVPVRIQRVAVMLHPLQALVDAVIDVLRPDILQTDLIDFDSLELPVELERLPVLRSAPPTAHATPPRVLFEGPRSGVGKVADWSAAQGLARRTQLVLAGGLDADNVARALEAVQPYGIDVSTGVERAPGIKCPERIREFVAAARAAAAATTGQEVQ
jgi:phosphoribosylanthranilate isomerase